MKDLLHPLEVVIRLNEKTKTKKQKSKKQQQPFQERLLFHTHEKYFFTHDHGMIFPPNFNCIYKIQYIAGFLFGNAKLRCFKKNLIKIIPILTETRSNLRKHSEAFQTPPFVSDFDFS